MNTQSTQPFPLEKIFGSRTRVKVITLFTTGIRRPYYVREIARHVNERLNAVRRELDILKRLGMLSSYTNKRRKYYTVNQDFVLYPELASIMAKAGPGIQDVLFKSIEHLGTIHFACLSGFFTGAKDSPTDLLIVGDVTEDRLSHFITRLEQQLQREITYTPITMEEYRYRRNFKDVFLRQIFANPYKELINNLTSDLKPTAEVSRGRPGVIVKTDAVGTSGA
jgi:hypothetical protein